MYARSAEEAFADDAAGAKDDRTTAQGQYLMSDPNIDIGVMFNNNAQGETYTDEQYEEFLEEMIFGGDLTAYVNRRSKEVVSEDFLDFLDFKLEESEDEEEKEVLDTIIKMIAGKLISTDGMGKDSAAIFEMRLDKLLFAPPNARKEYIKDNAEEFTDGFIEFVQQEMRAAADTDSKVVLASCLQLIGQMKDRTLLATSETSMLTQADASLGDQFAKNSMTSESGLLLNADSVDIAKAMQQSRQAVKVGDKNEQILGGLMFSENDLLEDVLNNLHEINEGFLEYMNFKIKKTEDFDERVAFTSLRDTIQEVLRRVREVEEEVGEVVDQGGEELSKDEVFERVKQLQRVSDAPVEAPVFSIQADEKETFYQIMSRFEGLPDGTTMADAVETNYNLCDMKFMEMLKTEAQECFQEGADIEGNTYLEILQAIQTAMSTKVSVAQGKLQKILERRDPKLMGSEMMMMQRAGEVDEALVLLIEANAQQAEQAGREDVSDVLKGLLVKVQEEKEKDLPDEQRLLRALLRLDTEAKRTGLLYDAFKPSVKFDAEEQNHKEGPPMISPPLFMNIVRTFIQNFGNIEGLDIMSRAKGIISEAETVATELYGESMSARDQQKFMFEKGTVSVWDLADFEQRAEMAGEDIPWSNDEYDQMRPEEFLGDRLRRRQADSQAEDDMIGSMGMGQ